MRQYTDKVYLDLLGYLLEKANTEQHDIDSKEAIELNMKVERAIRDIRINNIKMVRIVTINGKEV